MPIVLLILGALGLLAIGAGWLQNVTTVGAQQMNVDVFGWTLGPLSHGAWLLVAALVGMVTLACLLGAFALLMRSGRTRGAATATAGAPATRVREDPRRWDTDRARERATADEEEATTGGDHVTTGGRDVRDDIPHSDRGEFSDTRDDLRSRTSDTAPRATGDDQRERGELADKAKEKAKDAFDRDRNRR